MKLTHLLCIDYLQTLAASEGKLERVMTSTRDDSVMHVGLQWNEKKCAVVHVKKRCYLRRQRV